MNKEDPMQGIPEWLQPFTENLEDLETHVPAHFSERQSSDSEGSTKVGYTKVTETPYLYSFSERPKLRGFLAEDANKDLFREQKSLVI